MFGFQHSTEKAKKLILEAPDNTKKAYLVLLVTLAMLLLQLFASYMGMGSSWTCRLDNSDPAHPDICNYLRSVASCRLLTGPLKAQVTLDINNQAKASAEIVCPWENASSELRICFSVAAALSVVVGLSALSKESKKLSELHINSAYFFMFLLGLASTFDLFAVQQSEEDNYLLCNLSNELVPKEGVNGESMECNHYLYNFTAYFGYFIAGALLYSTYNMKVWKDNLSLDGL